MAETVDSKIVQTALAVCRAHADKLAGDASFSGCMHDNGASRLHELVEAYRAGMTGTVPAFLAPFIREARHQADPEFSEYQRLRRKFGDQKTS